MPSKLMEDKRFRRQWPQKLVQVVCNWGWRQWRGLKENAKWRWSFDSLVCNWSEQETTIVFCRDCL